MADVRVVWCGALCLLVALWSCDEGGQRGEQMTNVDPIEDRDMGSFDVLGDLSSDEDVLDEEVDASLVDCLGDDDCDDGVFCNGAERCFEGVCYENPQRVCVDLTDCTVDVCDEEGDACAYTPDAGLCGAGQVCDPKAGCFTPRECVRDEDCDDGVFCDGEERCVEERCAPGEPPSCADEVGCTVDGCVESARQCQRTPDNTLCLEGELCDPEQGGCVPQPPCAEDADCDDGRFCNGVERCDQAQGACVSGAPPAVEDGIGCTLDGCDESRGEVVHVPSAARCDNGLFCDGVERCDVEAGCVAGAAPTVDDGVVCTADACDEEVDEVVHVAQDGVCDNGLFCDGVERCDVEAGCVGGAAPEVDDGVDCTEDACDEEADEVVHSPSDVACDNGLFCDGVERCDVVEGCVAGAAVLLEDGLACTEGRCDEAQDQVVQLPLHERCDNGLFCDGAERCDAVEGCVAGGAPVVDDGVDCTEDACDEEADEVVHRPLDARCDDGQLCSGEERCDVVLGCLDGDALELDDGVLCTVDRCDDATGEVSHVPLDGRCDDGLFCNGVETCDVNGGCRPGVPPVVDDGVSCTLDVCDEEGDVVVHIPMPDRCNNGLFCDGVETCDVVRDCQAGTAPVLTDGVNCTNDTCDEANDRVVHTPVNSRCDNGMFCDGVETCDVVRDCQAGTAPVLSDGVSCTNDTCDEVNDRVVHAPVNSRCDNGLFCDGVETCDVVRDCRAGTAPVLTDGVNCTNDTCDEANDRVVHAPVNSRCDNGLFCDGVETCDVVRDCQAGTAPVLSDGVSCTNDTCDEVNDRVVHAPVNSRCDNGLFCDGVETCDVVRDCQAGTAPVLSDGVSCTNDTCDEVNDRVVHTPVNSRCDNGMFCDGVETCDVVRDCQVGTAPVLTDGVSCTNDTCDEVNNRVVHTPVNSRCDNGMFCDGVETCDVVRDCQAGTAPVLTDGVSCTNDTCDEVNNRVVHTPVNSRCDNGMFCDGVETCDVVRDCQAGAAPVLSDGVSCTNDTCDEANDRVVHAPVNSRCDNGMFCDGVETCDVVRDCQAGTAPVVDDGVGCTADSCDEGRDLVLHLPVDEVCDDRNLCNGDELCDPVNDCLGGDNRPDGFVCVDDPRSICLDGACGESFCGDGFVDPNNDERCDDGNRVEDDACNNACVPNQQPLNYNGDYLLEPRVNYACLTDITPIVNFNFTRFRFLVQNGTLTVSGIPRGQPNVTMTQAPAPQDGSFDVVQFIPGEAPFNCDETYRLTGMFIDQDRWVGNFTRMYVGPACDFFGISNDPCRSGDLIVRGTRL